MLTLTFAGDESGDTSFAFGKGASRYFVVAAIATAQPDDLRQWLAGLLQSSGLARDYEFKFNRLSSATLRKRVFEALASADFEAWGVIVDKPALSDPFKVMRGLEFYVYFVTELIQLISPAKRDGATLILDEFGSAARLRAELRHFMQARGIARQFKRVLTRRSSREPLIQIADMVASAILRRDAAGDASAYDFIAPKLRRLLAFRG